MTKPRETPPNPRPVPTTGEVALAEPNIDAFAAWMDAQLQALEARYRHLAAPRAQQTSIRRSGL